MQPRARPQGTSGAKTKNTTFKECGFYGLMRAEKSQNVIRDEKGF